MDSTEQELLETARRMLQAIHAGDAAAYRALCTPDLSCFETEVAPYRIDGVDFHLSLIETMRQDGAYASLVRFDMLTPRVQVHGDAGIVTYTRLMTYNEGGSPSWRATNETRVFVRQDGVWRMAHFHRSDAAP